MTELRVVKVLPYSQEKLYNVVADVNAYADFLPWCQKSVVLEEKPGEMLADLTIGYAFFKETFRSRVSLEPHAHIDVEYQQGPLKALLNKWSFKMLDTNTTEVAFFVSFTFKSKMMQKAMDVFFAEGADKLMQAFEQRLKKGE